MSSTPQIPASSKSIANPKPAPHRSLRTRMLGQVGSTRGAFRVGLSLEAIVDHLAEGEVADAVSDCEDSFPCVRRSADRREYKIHTALVIHRVE